MHASVVEQLPARVSVMDGAGDSSHTRCYDAHVPIFCEGDDADFLYEVLEGVICSSRLLSDGRRHVISFSYPGDLVGLSHKEYYRFSCDAVSPAKVRMIPRNAILNAVKDRPELGEKLLQSAADQLAEMHDHAVMLGCKSAIEKVTSFLLVLSKRRADGETIHLPMTRMDIADYLGLTVETVSRNLTKLRLQGVIDLPEAHTVLIRDMALLNDLADGEGHGL